MIHDSSTKISSALYPHLDVHFSLLHKNYWRRLRNNVTKFGHYCVRPFVLEQKFTIQRECLKEVPWTFSQNLIFIYSSKIFLFQFQKLSFLAHKNFLKHRVLNLLYPNNLNILRYQSYYQNDICM